MRVGFDHGRKAVNTTRAEESLKCLWSQDDLAGRLAAKGITMDQTAISRIENRSRYTVDYEAAVITRPLKVKVGWLLGES